MSGYTPLFRSLTTGTLCGRWPDIGLWPIILSLSDKHGIVDVTPQYIAGVTGLDVQQVVECMRRFCEPDPYSRTGEAGGARLTLIDPHRDWGWQIVNHAKYREKARLMAKDSARTESGRDAERKREERQSRDVPRSPPESPAGPLSDANTNTNTNTNKEKTNVELVFEKWQEIHNHPRAKLDAKRRKVITEALKLYSLEDLWRCIEGYKLSEWHMGKNDRKTVFDDIEIFLRSAKNIDTGINLAAKTKNWREDPRFRNAV